MAIGYCNSCGEWAHVNAKSGRCVQCGDKGKGVLIPRKLHTFDTETTGLSSYKNDIVTLSGAVSIWNGTGFDILCYYDIRMRPRDLNQIEQKALKTHKITIEELKEYPDPDAAFEFFSNEVLSEYCDPFDPADKMTSHGYRVKFDVDFLHSAAQKYSKSSGEKFYVGSFFKHRPIDVLDNVRKEAFFDEGLAGLPGLRLSENVAPYYGIEMQGHNSLEDIKGTMKVHSKIDPRFSFVESDICKLIKNY